MNNYALVENGVVINVVVAEPSVEETLLENGYIKYTDENSAFIGGTYVDNYFYVTQPHSDWTRDKGEWVPPIPKPDGKFLWDETVGEWLEFA